jgi:hypothetical protein
MLLRPPDALRWLAPVAVRLATQPRSKVGYRRLTDAALQLAIRVEPALVLDDRKPERRVDAGAARRCPTLAFVEAARITFQYDALFDPNLRRAIDAKRYVDRRETALVSTRQAAAGGSFDPSGPLLLSVSAYSFEAPQSAKTIENVGLLIRPKGAPLLSGPAGLRVSYAGSAPAEVQTNEMGMVATGASRPAGTNTAALEAWRWASRSSGNGSLSLDVDDLGELRRLVGQQLQPPHRLKPAVFEEVALLGLPLHIPAFERALPSCGNTIVSTVWWRRRRL